MVGDDPPQPKAGIIFKDNPLLRQVWCHITIQSMSILNLCMICETSICFYQTKARAQIKLNPGSRPWYFIQAAILSSYLKKKRKFKVVSGQIPIALSWRAVSILLNKDESKGQNFAYWSAFCWLMLPHKRSRKHKQENCGQKVTTANLSFVISYCFLKDKDHTDIIYDVVCFILAFILAKCHFLVFSFIALLPKPPSPASSNRQEIFWTSRCANFPWTYFGISAALALCHWRL